jgi:hypothetical protein
MRSTTSVHHWRFETGLREESVGDLWKHDPMPRGWYCWAYPADNHNFKEQMKRMCPTADVTFRFNSGDPMYTVYIKDDAEATAFQLMYGTN